MRFGLMVAMALGCAALLGNTPAQAAIAPLVPQMATPVAGPGLVQQAAYWHHGHRYRHRRWMRRHYYHGRWRAPHWAYY